MSEPIDPNPSDWYLQPLPVWVPPSELPRRRRRPTGSTILICCLVLAAVGTGVYFLVRDPDRPARLPIPVAFDGYTRISSPDTERVESTMRSTSGAAALFDSASIGFYSHNTGDTPRLIVIVFPAAAFPGGADEATDSIKSGLGVLPTALSDFPPGPRGGESLCGRLQFAAVPAELCAWADAGSAGAMISPATQMTPDRLAQIEQDFRGKLPR